MVMGSFTQKHVLIQTDQSESKVGCMGPFRLTNQGAGRVCVRPIREKGECVRKGADQSEFLDNFTMEGYERRVTISDMSVCLLFQ